MGGRVYKQAIQALHTIPKKQLHALCLADCSLLLLALPSVKELAGLKKVLAQRLQNRLTKQWIEHGDAGQVFATLCALWHYEPSIITGEQLAAAVNRLIAAELTVGGPYFKETAIATNVYIAIFMRLVAKPLPNMEVFLAHVVAARQFETTPLSLMSQIYLLIQAGAAPALRPYVYKQSSRPQWQVPLGLALTLAVLKDIAPPTYTASILKRLEEHQQKNGLWNDSSATPLLTTAIIASILANILHSSSKTAAKLRARQQAVLHAACQTCPIAQEPLRSLAQVSFTKVVKADTNYEITLLAWLFAQALRSPDRLTSEQHMHLSLASMYGWIAYTIYDDFLDGTSQSIKLPFANIAMRTALTYFHAAMHRHSEFEEVMTQICINMDTANAWEMQDCRFVVTATKITIHKFPQYGNRAALADRSLGHALGPIAVAISQGCRRHVQQYVVSGFRHYLIARQLSDDLQDWRQDIQAGQASYVVTTILRHMRLTPGTYSLNDLLPRMQKTFSHTTLPKIGKYILRHIADARQSFQKSNLLKTHNTFYDLLDTIEHTIKQTLDLHTKRQAFLVVTKQEKRFNE